MENIDAHNGGTVLKALIVDDEPASREVLTNMLVTYCPQIQVAGSAATVEEGLQMIGKEKPDLCFPRCGNEGGNRF